MPRKKIPKTNVNEQLFVDDINRSALNEKKRNRQVRAALRNFRSSGLNRYLDNVRKRVERVGDLDNTSLRVKNAIAVSDRDITRLINKALNESIKEQTRLNNIRAKQEAKFQKDNTEDVIKRRAGVDVPLKDIDKRTLNTPDKKELITVDGNRLKDNKAVYDYNDQKNRFKASARRTLKKASRDAIKTGTKAPLNNARRSVQRELETFIRTSSKALETEAKIKFMENNEQVIEEYIWQSVLDSRTSKICRRLNNKKFKVGEGPVPPAHHNCRSSIVPIVKKASKILPKEELNKQTRKELDGSTPDNDMEFEDVLNDLKADGNVKQLEKILGVRRAEMFIEGKLPRTEFMPQNL